MKWRFEDRDDSTNYVAYTRRKREPQFSAGLLSRSSVTSGICMQQQAADFKVDLSCLANRLHGVGRDQN